MTTQNMRLAATQKLEEIHDLAHGLLGKIEQLTATAPSRELSIIKTHIETARLFAKQAIDQFRGQAEETLAEVEQVSELTINKVEDQIEQIEQENGQENGQ